MVRSLALGSYGDGLDTSNPIYMEKNIIKRLSLLFLLLCPLWGLRAQESMDAYGLIPQPRMIQKTGTRYRLPAKLRLHYNDARLGFASEYLHQYLRQELSLSPTSKLSKAPGHISLLIDPQISDEEAYRLSISKTGLSVRAGHERGALYGVMTLMQLLHSHRPRFGGRFVLPGLEIDDQPRYRMRALMLDPARNFLPVAQVKRFLDRMARYKFNTLQLHLTDDQGWRVEIASHPDLTRIGARRSSHESITDNGFYTANDLKELVAYAAQRGIEIIPEVDVPGHTAALLLAKPELRCDIARETDFVLGKTDNVMLSAVSEATFKVLDDVLRELSEIFPRGTRIHLGGDESAIERNWAVSPEHQELQKKLGYDGPRALMSYFFERVLSSARKYGLRPMLWCELDNIRMPAKEYLFDYPKDVELITWRMGLTPKCLDLTRASGHKIILAPGEAAYFDYPQYRGDLPEFNNWGMPITTLERAYTWDLKNNLYASGDGHVLGVMGTLWGEAIKDMNRVFYMTYPRALALAEIGWTTLPRRDWASFVHRLPLVLDELLRSGIPYRPPFEVYAPQPSK